MDDPTGDDLVRAAWRDMVALVFDNRDTWRRRVAEEVGIPFSRVRVLKRLRGDPLTLRELATAAAMDAPAATVCVNHLEKLGYVVRTTDPDNRRRKQVTITEAGRRVLETVNLVDDPVPDSLRRLDPGDAVELRRILRSCSSW